MQGKKQWHWWLATGFGAGLSPIAPGTVGTLFGIPLVLFSQLMPVHIWILIVIFILCMSIFVIKEFSHDLTKIDHPSIVIDEIVGFIVAMMFVPITWQNLAMAFVIFRFMDIVKPPPINWIDRKFSGSYGIVGDDIVAGLYTNLLLQVILQIY
ncbi:MAG: phosphatidylglycerophosphatase A [Acidiferrobacteraceae bacterium]|nr:phosphatidylglycerophosphatase A [Acidiferrobacteraceae bacterium]|tara:strand:+ start:9670 stop:10128 length:459 start_codon:yes stop_codon:yes gene_type:complete